MTELQLNDVQDIEGLHRYMSTPYRTHGFHAVNEFAKAWLNVSPPDTGFEWGDFQKKYPDSSSKDERGLGLVTWRLRCLNFFTEENGWTASCANSPRRQMMTNPVSGEQVPTIPAYAEFFFFNDVEQVLISLHYDIQDDEFTIEVYAEDSAQALDKIASALENPNMFEGRVVRVHPRSYEVIVLEEESLSPYSDDVEEAASWLTSIADEDVQKRLNEAGFPGRAGLLLEGPPGSGKTTLTRRISRELQGKATILYPAPSPEFNVFSLIEFANNFPCTLIVFEDVEGFAGKRGTSAFSNFLNALDGAKQSKNIMFLATTNDSSHLDKALLRAGRLERRVTVGNVRDDALDALLAHRFADASEQTIQALKKIVEDKCENALATPAIIDSLVRHSLMLNLSGEALVAYAQATWEPNYEGKSYLG